MFSFEVPYVWSGELKSLGLEDSGMSWRSDFGPIGFSDHHSIIDLGNFGFPHYLQYIRVI